MRGANILEFLAFATLATARPLPPRTDRLVMREVPQEHSHEKILTSVRASLSKNNPAGIVDPVFALLGNAAAAAGAGSITDLDCLQQAVADQAFTNAKADGDIEGMTNALIFRTLERNTGAVGQKSALCTSLEAVNPEIAALTQHQDPASDGAADHNKQVALDLAVQIASIGGDPLRAIDSGTFAPGQIGDPTAKGNSCDDANDPEGCIFTQNLLVPDVTEDEINQAVAAAGFSANASTGSSSTSTSASSSSSTGASTNNAATGSTCQTSATTTTTSAADTATTTTSSSSTTTNSSTNTAATVTGDLGTCQGGSPLIEFGPGFDGRTEESFRPVDRNTFSHGSAQNIKIIADFICQQLNDKCKASADVIAKCQAGEAAATASGVSGQAAADAFNAAFS